MGGGRGDRRDVESVSCSAVCCITLYSIIDYIGFVWLSALMSFTCYTYMTLMMLEVRFCDSSARLDGPRRGDVSARRVGRPHERRALLRRERRV